MLICADFRVRSLLVAFLFGGLLCPIALLAQELVPGSMQSTKTAEELTVDRIYGQPSLNGRLSSAIAWSPDGKKLTFLETNTTAKETRSELWSIDIASGQRRLMIPAEKLARILPPLSDKQLLATRAGRRAPTLYLWAPSGNALLFEGPTSLAWLDLNDQTVRTLVAGNDELSDVKISPDGKYVSFLREHNIWLVSTADGKESALTTGGTEEIRKGELDWVYPEELEIFSAYWWAPDSSAIAYLEMDERKVPQFPLIDFDSYTGEAQLQRYPVAGGNNPVVRVLVASLSGGEPRAMNIGAETDIYIPRVNWLLDSHHIAIQRLNRQQTELDLLIADVTTGQSSILFTEKDQYWINVSDDLRLFKDGKRFLWSSERSGYRHLYLYNLDGKQLAQLSAGNWEVSRVDGLDEARGLVYFTATEKSPLERHLYRVSLDGSGITRLTKDAGTHSVLVSPNVDYYVDNFSDASRPPRQDLYRVDGSHASTINENKVEELNRYRLSQIEFFALNSHDGMLLNSFLIKPANFDPAKKYPVIVYTYGGPRGQVVLNEWGGETFLWHQMMAQKGYIIFALDNRGSAGRGHLFEEPIHYGLGAQELSDQLDGALWLQHQPWVDTQRIGIWGWSYGGHMALHAMFQAANIFKFGFAGGPVTDWHYYDSIYTERYLGLPEKNIASYKDSSPVDNAGRLKGRLLIAHGTSDDNVHYSNTLALVDDMIQHGKYVEVIAVPGRGHEVADLPASKMVWNRVTKFFLDNL